MGYPWAARYGHLVSAAGTILVVEDDVDVRDMLAVLLEDAGYRVMTAENGEDALRKLRASPAPILMFLDLTMPVMDGWAFIEERRTDPALAAIPVVVISAVAGSSRSAPYNTIAAIVEKPFDPEVVLEAVRRFG